MKQTGDKQHKVNKIISEKVLSQTNFITVRAHKIGTPLSLLIDTGADISIIKQKAIGSNKLIDTLECNINGINENILTTSAKTTLHLQIEHNTIEHDFLVFNGSIKISTDGILGRDILTKHNCKIDYETFTITIHQEPQDIVLPIYINIKTVSQINVPPRTEVIQQIDINLNEDSLVCANEIKSGIYIANAIIPQQGNKQ